MVAYNYSNTSVQTTLQSGITGSSTVISLTSNAGLPVSFPFTLILDYGQANVEVITVTGPSGGNYTVTRGEDGTAAQAHNPGAVVVHGVAARDLKQPQDHMAASAGVHGVVGAVVGSTDTQTLTNKTISGASNTLQNIADGSIVGLSASKLTGNFNGGSQFVSVADATVPLTAKGTATATGNLLELYKGTNNQLSVDPGGQIITAAGVTASGAYSATRATAAGLVALGKVTGDTQDRLDILADGSHKWGPGNAATDVTLARTGTGILGITGGLTVSTTLGVTGSQTIGGTLGVTGTVTANNINSLTNNASTDQQVNGKSMGRGIVYVARRSGGNLATNIATTTTIFTSPTLTLSANRMYRINVRVFYRSSAGAGDTYSLQLLDTGSQIGDAGIIRLQTANQPYLATIEHYVAVGGTPATPTYSVNSARAAGSFNFDVVTSATLPFWLVVEDIGPNATGTGVTVDLA